MQGRGDQGSCYRWLLELPKTNPQTVLQGDWKNAQALQQCKAGGLFKRRGQELESTETNSAGAHATAAGSSAKHWWAHTRLSSAAECQLWGRYQPPLTPAALHCCCCCCPPRSPPPRRCGWAPRHCPAMLPQGRAGHRGRLLLQCEPRSLQSLQLGWAPAGPGTEACGVPEGRAAQGRAQQGHTQQDKLSRATLGRPSSAAEAEARSTQKWLVHIKPSAAHPQGGVERTPGMSNGKRWWA